MKKNRPKTIPFSEFLNQLEEKQPGIKAKIEARAQELVLQMKLREARKQAHLSQLELAQRSGVNQDKISKIETGKFNPTIKTLQKIAAGMNKTIKIEIV